MVPQNMRSFDVQEPQAMSRIAHLYCFHPLGCFTPKWDEPCKPLAVTCQHASTSQGVQSTPSMTASPVNSESFRDSCSPRKLDNTQILKADCLLSVTAAALAWYFRFSEVRGAAHAIAADVTAPIKRDEALTYPTALSKFYIAMTV